MNNLPPFTVPNEIVHAEYPIVTELDRGFFWITVPRQVLLEIIDEIRRSGGIEKVTPINDFCARVDVSPLSNQTEIRNYVIAYVIVGCLRLELYPLFPGEALATYIARLLKVPDGPANRLADLIAAHFTFNEDDQKPDNMHSLKILVK